MQQVLALMVLRANQTVHIDTLVDELWDATPPRAAVTSVRTHVYHLRQLFEPLYPAAGTEELISTEPSGYRLHIAPEQVDSNVFVSLVEEARALAKQGSLEDAADHLVEALAMWRGRPIANVEAGPILSRYATALQEDRLSALELHVKVQARLGRHRELVGELKDIVAVNPFNEWFCARLIEALHRSGRRLEALDAFRSLRSKLHDELGVEPSGEVQQVHQLVLNSP